MEFFRRTNFDFMARRTIAIAFSVFVILAGIVSLVLKGGPAVNIDFTGGAELEIRFQQPKPIEALRNAVLPINLLGAEIKAFGTPRDFVIRYQPRPDTPSPEKIVTTLRQAFPDDAPQLEAASTIGTKIGRELRQSALLAILFSLGMILVYISVRFEFVFAIGAVIALFHDVLITVGIFSILNRELSLAVIGALLTLVGYSLNDTIVVFDRIRENLKFRRRDLQSIDQIINRSINDTLSRTILTASTTMMVVVVFLFFGGEVLRDFFTCLLIGILVGTYSSIFIAAPVVSRWHSKRRTTTHKARTAHAGAL